MKIPHQRAVPIATLLAGRSVHFGSNKATDKEYALSSANDDYTAFVSHSWSAPRTQKWLALLFRFSLLPACAAAHAAAVLSVVLSVTRVLPPFAYGNFWVSLGVAVDTEICLWAQVLGASTFVLVLLTYEHIHALLERLRWVEPSRCFLDKLCIHQTDAQLRQIGIDSIGVFLQNSRTMLVLWSPDYFSRLWCCFEMGVFLDESGPNTGRRIEFQPLYEAPNTFVISSISFAITGLYNALVVPLTLTEDPVVQNAIIFSLVVLLSSLGAFAITRMRYDEFRRSQLPKQIAAFRFASAVCAVESDRKLVTGVMTALHGASVSTGSDEHCEISHRLRGAMSKHVERARLDSYLPSLRGFIVVGTVCSLNVYDSVSMFLLIPADELLAAHRREVNQTLTSGGSCAESGLPMLYAANFLFFISVGFLITWIFTVLVHVICSLFPPARRRPREIASSAACWLLLTLCSCGLFMAMRVPFYVFYHCTPVLGMVYEILFVLVLLLLWAAPSLRHMLLRLAHALGWCSAPEANEPSASKPSAVTFTCDAANRVAPQTTATCTSISEEGTEEFSDLTIVSER